MKKYIFLLFLIFPQLLYAKIPENLDILKTCKILEDQGMIASKDKDNIVWRLRNNEDFYACLTTYKLIKSYPNAIENDIAYYYVEGDIAYYVEGNINKINKIYIVLGINDKKTKSKAIKEFQSTSEILFKRITGNNIPNEFLVAIENSKPIEKNINNYSTKLKVENWPSGNGYEMHFIIE